MIRGKNTKATVTDVAEGFTIVNPILLKPLDAETIKDLYLELSKKQSEVRAEKFPAHDMQGIRWRNLRLQRLHTAAMVIRNYAKARKIPLI
jgi:hypothetical protein